MTKNFFEFACVGVRAGVGVAGVDEGPNLGNIVLYIFSSIMVKILRNFIGSYTSVTLDIGTSPLLR